jgi:hypothetical protein
MFYCKGDAGASRTRVGMSFRSRHVHFQNGFSMSYLIAKDVEGPLVTLRPLRITFFLVRLARQASALAHWGQPVETR